MSAIIPLPPIHVTLRAVEWLTKSMTVIGTSYHAPVAWPACHQTEDPVHSVRQDWSTGVADVRALWLSTIDPTVTYKVISYSSLGKAGYPAKWVRNPVLTPNCQHCRILLDGALERAIAKTGAFRDVTETGKIRWMIYDGVTLQDQSPNEWKTAKTAFRCADAKDYVTRKNAPIRRTK